MPASEPRMAASDIPAFRAPYAPADEAIAVALLREAARADAAEARIDARATRLVEAIRARRGGLGGVEDFLHAYALSTREGLALMVLAEALLRVPDADTADRLIEDKLKSGDWTHHDTRAGTFLVNASAWTLGITARIIHPGETPEGILDALVRRLGLPAVRTATKQAMRLIGSHFVLAETIGEALHRAGTHGEFLYSFDMLGEGARTAADAERYFAAYAEAIAAIGKRAGNDELPRRPGISVKLSALHPRYEPLSRARVLKELTPRLLELARLAKADSLNFTVDAEEADRLELSLAVIAGVLRDSSLAGWDGFGLAVQAYQKRAPAVIDWIAQAAEALDRKLMVRLVKGAYWDGEIKRAQERGLADYPVFSRKAMTDLSYLDCARRLLKARPRLYPQFATHNALTVASVIEDAGGTDGLRIPAPAWHGRGALSHAARRSAGADLPRLCAGRRLCRPARLSGAPPVGERRQHLLRLGGGRSGGADRRYPQASAGLDRHARAGAPRAYSAAARPVRAGAQELIRRRIRRRRGARRLARRGRDGRHRAGAGRALDRRHRRARPRTPGALADRRRTNRPRRGGRRGGGGRGADGGAGGLCRLERDAGRASARRHSPAPAT